MVISNSKRGNFEKQSGELKSKWGTKVRELKAKLKLKANLT